jgi:ABC-type transport system substrate-binding protein
LGHVDGDRLRYADRGRRHTRKRRGPWGRDEIYGCQGSLNASGYCQRLVTRDLDQADRILDRAQQARVLNRADAQMARDVPVIPLLQGILAVYVRSNVRNFFMSFPGDYWKAENWWLAR